ncbi:MAG: hypothetical protein JXQ73_30505 [Phycisphaerae bacterium]|nr:hypothetical protein [Phycisphaerae bacterium]
MRRFYSWLFLSFMGVCCAFGLGACGDTVGSFVVDYIICPFLGKTP